MGEPRPELDQAWHDLLEGTLIRFSEDELFRSNNATSVRLEGGDYAGGLGISHSLHCLVSLIRNRLHYTYLSYIFSHLYWVCY